MAARKAPARFQREHHRRIAPRHRSLRQKLTAETLSIYPEYHETKQELGEFFGVEPDDFTLTNGTDEAIQVLINTYVDAGDEVIVLKPSYAMYRFYAELAGAEVREIPYRADKLAFPSTNCCRPSARTRAPS